MRIAFCTFGCKVNQAEIESLKSSLAQHGHTLAETADTADAVVINTCSVTELAAKKCRQFTQKLKKRNPALLVVATGCLAEQEHATLHEAGVDRVITNFGKDALFSYLADNADCVVPVAEATGLPAGYTQQSGGRTRAFLKIQDGCDSFCSYCIIPHLRGVPRSKNPEDVAAEFSQLVAAGFLEVVLVGIHIGKYGIDRTDGASIATLVASLVPLAEDTRIRLSSIEVGEVTEELLTLMQAHPATICPHLHIPLQSGSNAVLSAMNRTYTREQYIHTARTAKEMIPELTVGADVIVGFPGETDEQFRESVATIREAGVDFLHVFPYSEREGTPAATMQGSIPEAVRQERAQYLRTFAGALTFASAEKLAGTSVRVLSEKGGKGLTDNYFSVEFIDTAVERNRFCKTTVIGVQTDGTLLGKVERYE